MEIKKIGLVMKDDKHLEELEWSLLQYFGNRIEIESITDLSYLNEVYREFTKQDMILADEALVSRIPEDCQGEIHPVKDIDETIQSVKERMASDRTGEHTRVQLERTEGIMCYSPIGGCGKTVISLALAEYLGNRGYKVLYISIENLQSFQHYLEENRKIEPIELMNYITSKENNLYLQGKHVGHCTFDYLLPVRGILSALGIESDAYIYFIEQIMKSRVYDYIVFDASTDLNEVTMRLMADCFRIAVILGKSEQNYKIEEFLNYVDASSDQFCFLGKYPAVQMEGLVNVIEVPAIEGRKKDLVQELAQCEKFEEVIR